ncbi:MAG: phosphate acyltransferase PlsX [Leptospirales bacterium]
MWIAIDAAGADLGPEPIVSGAIMAIQEYNLNVILVGNGSVLEGLVSKHSQFASNIRIEHAPQTIDMDESPGKAIRDKKDSSIMIATRLVKDGEAIGFFSPGNTGASMASAFKQLGRLPKVKRPVIVTPIPRQGQAPSVLVDAGANVDSNPDVLLQSAIMGEIYSREILKVIHPSIGILSNGEEESKGTELTQKVYKALKKLPINFVGNVEGRDMFGDGKLVDVIVTDGFTGNIVIKTIEGAAKAIFNILKNNIKESPLAKTGALLLKPTLQAVKRQMDHSSYGGAPLLGVNGIVMIGHGSSNAWSVKNALRITKEFSSHKINRHIVDNIEQFC